MVKLSAYHAKREFQKTPEPRGRTAKAQGFTFVVQKHDATRLHYDFRLELDGVLKSWAVTKGPSLTPGEKRLAVHVEDHPLDYGAFEGTIPKGQYGGGTVLLWDRGVWEPEGDPRKGYAKGHLRFRLHGEKLRGGWHLVRMRRRPKERQEQWLLIKSEDEWARSERDPDIVLKPRRTGGLICRTRLLWMNAPLATVPSMIGWIVVCCTWPACAGAPAPRGSARELWKRLKALRINAPPFEKPLNALQKRDAVWVRPELVAEVEFRGWTADHHLRHAAFKGLREERDKDAREVAQEAPTAALKRGRSSAREETRVSASGEVEVAGVPLTHPDRILWEEQGVTKQGLAEYYEAVADWILPHVVHRPLALVRCPSGSQKGCFFQKHSWAGLSDFIRRETVRDEGGEEEVLLVEDTRGVIALVQAGVLEIHPWGARIDDVEHPDRIVMDLDPGEGVAWPAVIEGARELRERLKALELESFVKTTGGKGLHVVLPIAPAADWKTVKAFAKDLADAMERDNPQTYVATSVKKARTGRIYVDYLRNGRGATAVAAYSTRARPGAPVSTPLAWDELSPAVKPNHFNVSNVPARLERLRNDPWAEVFQIKQTLPSAKGARTKRKIANRV